jgi:hypothetical protein
LRRRSLRRSTTANHDISCHQAASNFCQLSIPLVLTISETYDHILQYGVR